MNTPGFSCSLPQADFITRWTNSSAELLHQLHLTRAARRTKAASTTASAGTPCDRRRHTQRQALAPTTTQGVRNLSAPRTRQGRVLTCRRVCSTRVRPRVFPRQGPCHSRIKWHIYSATQEELIIAVASSLQPFQPVLKERAKKETKANSASTKISDVAFSCWTKAGQPMNRSLPHCPVESLFRNGSRQSTSGGRVSRGG